MIKKIFSWIGGVLNIVLILALILYPIIVESTDPITFYWNGLKELWIVIKEPHLLSKFASIFK